MRQTSIQEVLTDALALPSPDRPPPTQQAAGGGALGSEGPHRGRARQPGGSQARAVTQPPRLPRERFTTSPIRRRLLDGASRAIPGLYFIVTFICKGCQSDPEVSRATAPRSPGHACRGPHSLGPHAQGAPGDTRSAPGAAGQSGHTTHSVHTRTQSPGIEAVPAHNSTGSSPTWPRRCTRPGSETVHPSHTHTGTHTNTDTPPSRTSSAAQRAAAGH